MDSVLGCRPITDPVASVSSMSMELQKDDQIVEDLINRYGQGTVFEETCPKCGYVEEGFFSAGVHESTSGAMRIYSENDELVCPRCPPATTINLLALQPGEPSQGSADIMDQPGKENMNYNEIPEKGDPVLVQSASKSNVKPFAVKRRSNSIANKSSMAIVQELTKAMTNMHEKEEKLFKEQEEQHMKFLLQMEEKRIRHEEEQEQKREEAERRMFDKHMEMFLKMQMGVVASFSAQNSKT